MASAKISDLTDGGAVQTADEVPVARAGANAKVKFGSIASQHANNVVVTGGTVSNNVAIALGNTHVLVGNANNVAVSLAINGDGTLTNTGALTITKTGGTAFGTAATNNSSAFASSTLNSANILVGNAGNVATSVSLSGDASLSNAGALTLANTAVTAGLYGNNITVPQITVDSKGRLTSVSNVAISAGSLTIVGNGNTVNSVTTLNFTSGATITTPGAGEARVAIAASGGASLDAITAAAGDQAGIANADNNIRWNWQKTTNSEVAFEFGESAASTNGTSTSGVPNQVLLKLSTVASSTMSPLQVRSRGSHVFSISPSAAQILAASGGTNNPTYAFAAEISSGVYLNAAGDMRFSVSGGGNDPLRLTSDPAVLVNGIGNAGAGIIAGHIFNVTSNGTNLAMSLMHNSASTLAPAINARKSRGSAASPSVITTGDDLLTISGYGYVGGTNTYQEAARITFDSTGTIADTATGVGGIIRFHAACVGAEPAEIMRLTAATTTGGGWATMNEADALPGTSDLTADDEMAYGFKAGKLWFAVNVGGAMKFLHIVIDGSTTAWTADGTGP